MTLISNQLICRAKIAITTLLNALHWQEPDVQNLARLPNQFEGLGHASAWLSPVFSAR